MLESVRRHVSPALVLALAALFAAIGGVAYAVKKAPKNSVVSKSIKAAAVRTADIQDGAVISSKLADGAVTTSKLANDAVNGSKVADGSLAGADIAGGIPVPLAGYEVVSGPVTGGTGSKSITLNCPGGKKAVGGGFSTGGVLATNNLSETTNAPVSGGTAWRVDIDPSDPADAYNLGVIVACANAP